MALYAAFVGVDKHRDLEIRDLTGARRDATALWTLFSDTLPDITSALIVNAEATVERVRQSLDETLGAAGTDDTVIITFSGHGTHDHRLIALSAVIGEVNDFDAWLGARRLVTDRRPVPLIEGVLDRSGSFRFVDVEGRSGRRNCFRQARCARAETSRAHRT